MYFRSQKKLQGEVSLSDTIESDREGDALQLSPRPEVHEDLIRYPLLTDT